MQTFILIFYESKTQSGFIPKKHIVNNIHLVLVYAKLIKEERFILFLDFYKAFDSLEYKFILQSLYKFGLGDLFCKTVWTLYKNGNYLFLISAPLLTFFCLIVNYKGLI